MNKTKKRALILGVAAGAALSFSAIRASETKIQQETKEELADPFESVLFKNPDEKSDFAKKFNEKLNAANAAQKKPCSINALKTTSFILDKASWSVPTIFFVKGALKNYTNFDKTNMGLSSLVNRDTILGFCSLVPALFYRKGSEKCKVTKKGLTKSITTRTTEFETEKNKKEDELATHINSLTVPTSFYLTNDKTEEDIEFLGHIQRKLSKINGFDTAKSVIETKMKALKSEEE